MLGSISRRPTANQPAGTGLAPHLHWGRGSAVHKLMRAALLAGALLPLRGDGRVRSRGRRTPGASPEVARGGGAADPAPPSGKPSSPCTRTRAGSLSSPPSGRRATPIRRTRTAASGQALRATRGSQEALRLLHQRRRQGLDPQRRAARTTPDRLRHRLLAASRSGSTAPPRA